MTADLYVAARDAVARALYAVSSSAAFYGPGLENAPLSHRVETRKYADQLLAALDVPARAALLAWLLPEDRLAAALERADCDPMDGEHHGIAFARAILAALTDPATDGGR